MDNLFFNQEHKIVQNMVSEMQKMTISKEIIKDKIA